MNLLHISNADITGGAAQATYQLHTLLKEAGHRSILAVRRKDSSDPEVVEVGARSLLTSSWPERIERIRSRLSGGYRITPTPPHYFNRNIAPIPNLDAALEAVPHPDVVFLHWITHLMTVADIRRVAERVACPIVWVLLDMEPMTGGCHYSGECKRFHTECKDCPQLQIRGVHDWAARTWHEKRKQLADLPITFLAPTKWLRDRLTESELFRKSSVAQIPLPMNIRMRPFKKSIAREILGLPKDKKIILVGCHNLKDSRKGMDRLIAAARVLDARMKADLKGPFRNEEVLFLLIGVNGGTLVNSLPFQCRDDGYLSNDIVLSLTYQAADLFACPSMEDAGPMMVSQAMLCGTPVVAFSTGIVPELITSGKNGYIARLGDAEDFARGLEAMLNDDGSAGVRAAEGAASHHDTQNIVKAYGDLLENITLRNSEHNCVQRG